MSSDLPRLEPASPTPDTARAVVLVLHGGRPNSREGAGGFLLSHQRMVPFARAVARAGAPHGVETALLRYRVKGWNDPGAGSEPDPVRDARWALADVRARHGSDVPIVLVGHSMGARTALRVGSRDQDPNVAGVAALAPWIEMPRGERDAEPWEHLAGQTLLVAHGDRERMTSPKASLWFADRVATVSDRVARFDVLGDGHAMLRRAGEWHRLVARFALAALGLEPFDAAVANAMAAGAPDGLSVPLVSR